MTLPHLLLLFSVQMIKEDALLLLKSPTVPPYSQCFKYLSVRYYLLTK